MKKLNFPPQQARTPIWTNDLEYLQDGIGEAFGCILDSLGFEQRDIVISGCKITTDGTRVSMSAGWCYYEGEIIPVRALPWTPYTGSNPKIKFTRVANSDHTGDRIVLISDSADTLSAYKEDYLQPSLVTGQETYRLAIGQGAWDLRERIVNAGKAVDSGVISVEGAGDIRYRMIGGVVQVYGHIRQDAIGNGWHGAVATGLPRPAVTVTIPFSPVNLSERIVIDTDGVLSVYANEDIVYFDHVLYLATPLFNVLDGHFSTILQPGEETI